MEGNRQVWQIWKDKHNSERPWVAQFPHGTWSFRTKKDAQEVVKHMKGAK
jgi:hypothetical protein